LAIVCASVGSAASPVRTRLAYVQLFH
jgi:hypothetical protein